VPHEPPRWSRATRPLALLGNAMVLAAAGPPAWTARVTWTPSREPPAASKAPGPVVYVAWHRYNLALTPPLARLPPGLRPTLVMHDGLASRGLTHEASAWLGFETFVFRRRSPVSPRDQIAAYVRSSGRSIVVLPDAGGPYGRVKPGVLRVAADCGAWVQPFVPRVRGAVVVGRTLRHVVPLPACSIEVVWGDPLAPGATAEACQRGLDALGDA